MKTSSITLISLIGLALVAAFFFPVLSMRRVEMRQFTISASGEPVTLPTDSFTMLDITGAGYLDVLGTDTHQPQTVRIYAADTVTAPRLVMDRTWRDLADITMEHDTLYVNFSARLYGDNDTIYRLARNATHLCDIIVPQGMLRTIAPSYNLTFQIADIRQPSLSIPSETPVTMTGCVIGELKIEN